MEPLSNLKSILHSKRANIYYLEKVRISSEGEVVSLMTKASGTLEVYLDIKREKAKEIRRLIENTGISSFCLGKKGLAYVTDIDAREVSH